MYSLFLGAFSWFLCGALFLIGHLTGNHDVTSAGWTFFVISLVIMVAILIAQYVQTGETKQTLAGVETSKRKIKLEEEKYNELKEFYEKQVLDVYPNFEKTLLEALSPSKNTDLLAIFQQYPELQSSKLVRDMVDKITQLVKNIYDEKRRLEIKYENIRVYRTNSWIIFKIKFSETILNEL